MQVEIPLGQPARILLAALASLLTLALASLAIAIFLVGSLTTPTLSLSRSETQTASRYFPNSSEIQALLAYSELANDRDYEAAAKRAELAGLRAAQLTPKRYEYRLIVASAREMKGDRPGAEQALREGLALGPTRVETFWRLANSLLRQGKLDESLSYFSRVISARPALISQTLSLIWEVSGGNPDKLKAAVGKQYEGSD
jgi:tetratricopeptide (TPR) repeat protein